MPEIITSRLNPRIKTAARLRDSRVRQKLGLIVIDGIREVERALESKIDFSQAFILESCQQALLETTRQLASAEAEIVLVSDHVFEKLAFGNRHEGIVATARTPQRSLADLPRDGNVVIGVIEAVEKPGNVGAIVRSADAAGVGGVIVANPGTDLFNPNTIRASLGTVFSMPICTATSTAAKAWLEETETNTFSARLDAAIDYTEANFRGRTAIVLGSEAEGVSREWRDTTSHGIKLPMLGIADSLNVSVTAAILFYEALRQRTTSAGTGD